MLLIAVYLLAMVCCGIAAPPLNPQYQKPTTSYALWELMPSYHCGTSTFTYFGTDDKLVPIADCNNMLSAYWKDYHYTYELSSWQNSTELADHFFILARYGDCEFALKRLDGINNMLLLGDQDIRDVVNSSIASSRDGATFETVEGQMICDTEPGYIGNSVVNLEWTLRTPGSVN